MDEIKSNECVLKPMLSTKEMVAYLKEKNIKFEYMKENEAEKYLRENNNYYSVVAYRNNFERYFIDGKFIDRYVCLDFAYLVDLASMITK